MKHKDSGSDTNSSVFSDVLPSSLRFMGDFFSGASSSLPSRENIPSTKQPLQEQMPVGSRPVGLKYRRRRRERTATFDEATSASSSTCASSRQSSLTSCPGRQLDQIAEWSVPSQEHLFCTDTRELWVKAFYARFMHQLHVFFFELLVEARDKVLLVEFLRRDLDLCGRLTAVEARAVVASATQMSSDSDSMNDFMRNVHGRKGDMLAFGDLFGPWSSYTWPAPSPSMHSAPAQYRMRATELQADWPAETTERLRNLKLKAVRKGLVEYKVALHFATEMRIINDLSKAQSFEEDHGLGDKSMRYFHELITGSFEGDMELLFELFMGVDKSENMHLESDEIKELILLLDSNASKEDVTRYLNEMLQAKEELNYVGLLEWWYRISKKPDSIVAQKGTAFLLLLKARSVSSGLFRYACGLADLEKRWRKLAKKDPPKLHRLRESYRHTFVDLRRYNMKLHLVQAEESCLQPSRGHKDSDPPGITWEN